MLDIKDFEKLPLMGILRGVDETDINGVMESVIDAGLKVIEVTMNTPNAAGLISKIRRSFPGQIEVGAGTVLSRDDFYSAKEAGAGFMVMPVFEKEIMDSCKENGIPAFPGALTPKEVHDAWRAGAAMVKVFPSDVFGPSYMRSLKGPFDKIKLMAVGGIRLETIGEYFSSGADAVAFGGGVFKKEWLRKKDFRSIGDLVRKYVEAVKASI
jgi:2-dehydro-3-deoxyphosphogluconate aldolase/(4S)-4-hydroxy-2-oxoglutarate aldolase